MNPNDNNINHGMFFFTNENGELKPLVEIKSLNESEIINPKCELKCAINTAESFCATLGISEETEAALWAMCEGLEITEGE